MAYLRSVRNGLYEVWAGKTSGFEDDHIWAVTYKSKFGLEIVREFEMKARESPYSIFEPRCRSDG